MVEDDLVIRRIRNEGMLLFLSMHWWMSL